MGNDSTCPAMVSISWEMFQPIQVGCLNHGKCFNLSSYGLCIMENVSTYPGKVSASWEMCQPIQVGSLSWELLKFQPIQVRSLHHGKCFNLSSYGLYIMGNVSTYPGRVSILGIVEVSTYPGKVSASWEMFQPIQLWSLYHGKCFNLSR